MENFEWSKTILTVYRYLKRMTIAFDRMVKSRAYNSFYSSTENYTFNNIFDISNNILNLTERKVTLINLKVLTEQALKSMDKSLAKVLIFKYIENRKAEEVAKILNISTRTYFRRITSAHQNFYKTLVKLGYDENKLLYMLSGEKWILKTYQEICNQVREEQERDSKIFEEHLKRNIYYEIKSATLCVN